MTSRRRTAIGSWIAIGALGAIVLALLGALIWRLIDPPILPYVAGTEESVPVVIQCDIVNASGISGAGRTMMTYLRERGFDVVELSTAGKISSRSTVLDRVGDRPSALRLAAAVGIADSLVVPAIDSMLFVRASVILGADVSSLPALSP
jgi:LytR cell envelope-related transcriptional attenuator